MSDILVEIDELKDRLDKVEMSLKESVDSSLKLTEHVEKLSRFCAVQVDINNIMRYLVKRKYSQKELEEALKEYEEAQKRLHSDDENLTNLHKNETEEKK